ncbi:hypothetical protein [Microbulbifer sediminum]|nr:hypothetical protein [Microbulbifer sediminum]
MAKTPELSADASIKQEFSAAENGTPPWGLVSLGQLDFVELVDWRGLLPA